MLTRILCCVAIIFSVVAMGISLYSDRQTEKAMEIMKQLQVEKKEITQVEEKIVGIRFPKRFKIELSGYETGVIKTALMVCQTNQDVDDSFKKECAHVYKRISEKEFQQAEKF